jgi:hypothetical protein
VVSVSCGFYHTAALTVDGKVVCWGSNDNGQCNVPDDLDLVGAVSCGHYFVAVLTRDGVVRCWGENDCEQCNVPEGLGKVVALSCGGYHVAALTEDGRLVCWGWNVHGQCVIPNDLEVMIPPPASLPIELQAMISEISLSSDPTMSHVEIASVASEHLVTTPQSEAAALPSDLQVIISETEPTTLPLPSPAAQPDQTELEQLRNQLAEALAERDTFMHKLESSDHSNVQVCFVAWFRLTCLAYVIIFMVLQTLASTVSTVAETAFTNIMPVPAVSMTITISVPWWFGLLRIPT